MRTKTDRTFLGLLPRHFGDYAQFRTFPIRLEDLAGETLLDMYLRRTMDLRSYRIIVLAVVFRQCVRIVKIIDNVIDPTITHTPHLSQNKATAVGKIA